MAGEGRRFFEVFPKLTLPEKIRELFDQVLVVKVIKNSRTNVLKIYVACEDWIKKEHFYTVAGEIEKQVFPRSGAKVQLLERFHLSSQYNPQNFYKVYRKSMEAELEMVSPLTALLFRHSELLFPEPDCIEARIPSNDVLADRATELLEYIEKVFVERAGFGRCQVTMTLFEIDRKALFAEDRAKIESHVDAIVRRAKKRAEEKPKEEEKLPTPEKQHRQAKFAVTKDPDLILGRPFDDPPVPMDSLGEDPHEVVVRGEIFDITTKEMKNGKMIIMVALTDHTDSIRMKLWAEPKEMDKYMEILKKGRWLIVKGRMDFDRYEKEIMINTVYSAKRSAPDIFSRIDDAPKKRVELHCHTKMSDMDAVSSATEIIGQAKDWGMTALAITDHGVVQAFPEAHHAAPETGDFKVIYGCEGYLVDDEVQIVTGPADKEANAPAVAFALTTTGPGPSRSDIVEISAVRIVDGRICETFSTLVNPEKPLPFAFRKETRITDEMTAAAPRLADAFLAFAEFCSDAVLVAFDAEMQAAFLRAAEEKCFPGAGSLFGEGRTLADLPAMVRYLLPQTSRNSLEKLAKSLKIPLDDPARSASRARATAEVYLQLQKEMKKAELFTFEELNKKGLISEERIRNLPYYHIILLVKNEAGRRNLYTMVSESHLRYFKKRPRIPRSLLKAHRDGIVVGSACSAGELYKAVLEEKSTAEIEKIVRFYDYLEVQPVGNNEYMVREHDHGIQSDEDLREINRKIVQLGEIYDKSVVATCDVHFLNPGDAIYRSIIQSGHGFKDEGQPPLYLHTTGEMLEEFAYLGKEKAFEIVVENSNKIADTIEKISPIHPDKCPPVIENSDTELEEMCYATARSIYGENVPEQVTSRLKKELGSIIKNGYAVMYIIAQRLVQKSREDGYLVGSRGSVGSSLVATMSNITEVNPLPPHYLCGKCHFVDFDSPEVKAYGGRCGADMPDRKCPVCGEPLKKLGFDIPFETFLGFKGDKEPDIDLNFSGEEQTVAQNYTEVIFGKGQTFKAGTIGTVAEKTAVGLAAHYFEEKGIAKKHCELERLSKGCVGVRRTTGQHPGGVIVLPKGMDINWFTPVQHPANDMTSDVITTHFDYHSIDRNLLKLDILGHDDPTIIRMLEDLTGTNPLEVPLDDPGVISLFSGTEALGATPEEIGVDLGVLGVPEFGTKFVMQMLRETKPKSLSELVRISGLSHGTDVWTNNAQEYVKNGDCTLSTAICTRDDIMIYLIACGVEPEHSFKIMEGVRKGKGLKPEQEAEMREHNVPNWYIESCKKIKYMFPKAHAAAYVMNAFRIAYYKINYPLAYYAAMFSIRVTTFDYGTMALGRNVLEEAARAIQEKEERSAKEEETLKDMMIVREMYGRGFTFHTLDLAKADALRFTVLDGKLMPSINSIQGLGETNAKAIAAEVKKGPFLSKEEFRTRTRSSTTITDLLETYGILGSLPETNQLSFDFA